MKTRLLISAFCILHSALLWAPPTQPAVPPSTPYTRQLLTNETASAARLHLGVSMTNGVITDGDYDDVIVGGTGTRMTNVAAAGNFAVAGALTAASASISGNQTNAGTMTAASFTGVGSNITHIARVVNVRDYGAVGDGSTDDTAAIKAALLAHQGGYATEDLSLEATLKTNSYLYFPAGKYRYTEVLQITNTWVEIRGQGHDRSVLLPDAGVWGLTITNSALHCRIRDFTIQGQGTGVGLFIGSAVGPHWNPGAPGSWPIESDITIKDFEIGSICTQMHNARIYNSVFDCRVALIATNIINGCDFGGFFNRYTDTAAILGGIYNCTLNIRHWDPQQSTGGSNVVKIVGGINNMTIRGRTEMHNTNSVGVRLTGSASVVGLKLEDVWFQNYIATNNNAWALYFEDTYTNGTATAVVIFDNCLWDLTNTTYSGHIRLPHATSVRMRNNGFSQPKVSLFEGTSLTHRTNFYVGNMETVYGDWTAYIAPNSFPEYSHNLYFRRPSTNGADELWCNYYTGTALTVDRADILKLPILDKVGGVALTNTANTFTYGQSIITGTTFGSTVANTNANSTDKFFRVGALAYNTALNPLVPWWSHSVAATATLYHGGGTGSGTPYETHLFYTGDSTASGAGSPVVGIYQDGGVSIGSAANAPSDPGDGNLTAVGRLTVTNFASPTNTPVIGDAVVASSTTGATKWGTSRQTVFVGGTLNLSTTARTPAPSMVTTLGSFSPTLVSRSIIFTNLYLRLTSLATGTNATMTLYTNGVATSFAVTFNGAGAAIEANSGTTSATCPAGSYWSWHWVGNNGDPSVAHIIAGSYELLTQ